MSFLFPVTSGVFISSFVAVLSCALLCPDSQCNEPDTCHKEQQGAEDGIARTETGDEQTVDGSLYAYTGFSRSLNGLEVKLIGTPFSYTFAPATDYYLKAPLRRYFRTQ